jgi:archaellum biogenesis ATPase FlaH
VQVVTIDSLNDIPFWLSTGDDVLDLFISNRKNGGIPGSRISSIDGLQQSGKSLVCSHLIKSCQ